MINVILVARYPTVRAGFASVLGSDGGLNVLAETSDLEQVPALVGELLPDVLLVDLVDEPPDSLPFLRELASAGSLPPLVLISGSATDALEGMGLSNSSLLLRDATPDEIQTALRTATSGLIAFDQRIVQMIDDELASNPGMADADESILLTPRELDVLQGVARGLPNKSVAQELSISEHTVKFHIGSIFQKLEVSSRSEAIVVAVRLGLLDLRL